MSDFTPVLTGNLANTPMGVAAVNQNLSPTELSAFQSKAQQVSSAAPAEGMWETLDEERWTEPKLGDSISNTFKRVTRVAQVPGGNLYSTCTYLMTYVRGVSDSAISETLIFVPDQGTTEEPKPVVKTTGRAKKTI